MTRAFVTAGLLISVLLPVRSAVAQESDEGAVSVDSAEVIRASFDRPPGDPPFDGFDAVALPFRIATFPIKLFGSISGWVIGQLTKPGPPPFYLVALRDVSEWGLVPSITTLGPRSGPAIQVRLEHFRPFYAQTSFSIRQSQHHTVGLVFGGPSRGVDLAYSFTRHAQPHFWGIGPDTREEDRSDFLWDRDEVALTAWTGLVPRVTVGGGAAYEENSVGVAGFDDDRPDLDETFDTSLLFGAEEETKFVRFDLFAHIDVTHWQQFQRRGVWIGMGSSVFRGAEGTNADFHRLTGELHGYVPLNRRQQLAIRGVLELNRDDSGRGVPFTHLARVGSREGNRGFSTGRFHDRDRVVLMSDWRYEIWRELQERSRVEGVVFLDVSGVERNVVELDGSDLEFGYGFGMRVAVEADVALVWYLGLSDETARLRGSFSWVF